jgi:hypothetical protein
VSYLLRLVLPDRPGALGAVATALGDVGADIMSVDVIERDDDRAVDDFVVELPPGRLADSLVTAAGSVNGVEVESIRPYAGTIDPHRELEVLDRLAAGPDDPLKVLADGVTRIFRAGWSVVLGGPTADIAPIIARSAAAPEIAELAVPWWPPRPARLLDAAELWAPHDWAGLGTELAVAPLDDGALLVGRPALRWLPAELMRLRHLAGVAASVTRAESAEHLAAGPSLSASP